jgi:Flp pilus assembly protein TadB
MGLSSRTETVGGTWRRASRAFTDDRAVRSVRAAERNVEAAAGRYQALRSAASEVGAGVEGAAPRRRPSTPSTWQRLLLVVLGGGLLTGSLVMWLIATAYVGPVALLVLPPTAALVVGFLLLRRHRPPASRPRHRPVVADLVRAAQEVQDAEAALQRARARAMQERQLPEPPPVGASEVPRDRVPWPRARRRAPQA